MKPIQIPDSDVEAYNGERVLVSAPDEIAEGIDPCPALRVTDQWSGFGFKILIELDGRDVELVTQSRRIWLNFHSRMFPVFSIRPADKQISRNEGYLAQPGLPVMQADEKFYTEARTVWPALDLQGVIRGIEWVNDSTEIWFKEIKIPIEPGQYLLHNVMTGDFWVIHPEVFDHVTWFDPEELLNESKEKSIETEPVESKPDNDTSMFGVFPETPGIQF